MLFSGIHNPEIPGGDSRHMTWGKQVWFFNYWGLRLHLQLWQGEVTQSFLVLEINKFIETNLEVKKRLNELHPKLLVLLVGDVLPKLTSQQVFNITNFGIDLFFQLRTCHLRWNGYWVEMVNIPTCTREAHGRCNSCSYIHTNSYNRFLLLAGRVAVGASQYHAIWSLCFRSKGFLMEMYGHRPLCKSVRS